MKPLQTLDVMMLWIARVFTVAMLVLFAFPLINLLLIFVLELGTYLFVGHPREPFSTSWLMVGQIANRPQTFVAFALAVLWFISLRLAQSVIARLCMGVTAGFAFFCSCSTAVIIPRMLSHHADVLTWIFVLIGVSSLVGFGAMLWAAIRPPPKPGLRLANV